MPAIFAFRAAASLFPRPLTLSAPSPACSPSNPSRIRPQIRHCCRRPSSRRRRFAAHGESLVDSSRGSISSLPSTHSTPNPAPSPPLQGRWRAPSPAAAHRRRAATLLPLFACITAGELRHHLGHAMRPRPELLQPRSAAPPSAGATASRARAWARPGAGSRQPLALTRPGGATRPPGPTCRWPGWLPRVYLAF